MSRGTGEGGHQEHHARAERDTVSHPREGAGNAHRRHGDHVWAVLRGAALALHWYNPLVWLSAALSKRDGELACDEGALRHADGPSLCDYYQRRNETEHTRRALVDAVDVDSYGVAMECQGFINGFRLALGLCMGTAT